MRTAYQDVAWLMEEDGLTISGFSVGFDFCAEHEWGASGIKKLLGIEETKVAAGIESRAMRKVPDTLFFIKYTEVQKNNKTKKKEKYPAAFLLLSRDTPVLTEKTAQAVADDYGCSLFSPFYSTYQPEKDDLASAWSGSEGLAINVRGAKNVERLETLYNAFLRKDIVLADASICGFKRTSMALVIGSMIPDEVAASVLANDKAAQRLQEAVKATGIEERLQQAGLNWYALMPKWKADEGAELSFYLNPCKQDKYNGGWFSLAELEAWIDGKGPIVKESNAVT